MLRRRLYSPPHHTEAPALGITTRNWLTATATLLLLAATGVQGQDGPADTRRALGNRELAAAGLAVAVTVHSGTDCSDVHEYSEDEAQTFRDFFGTNAPIVSGGPRQTSGVIIEDGEILSLSIEPICAGYLVILPDGRDLNADLVGIDEVTGLALLRTAAGELGAARIGDPHALRPGDRVLSVGSPLDFAQTLSEGIVSTARRVFSQETSSVYIQSDVSINAGSAGSPLLNEYGEVVGIMRERDFDGLSFALPIDVALRLAQDLRELGRVRRARLGLTLEASHFGEPGAVVFGIDRDSPLADRARLGDRIVELDGERITTPLDLRFAVQMRRPGTRVRLSAVRDGATLEWQVTLAERPER